MSQFIHISGNLTRDPELKETPQGVKVCNYTVAVNSSKRGVDADGKPTYEKKTTYYRVTSWGSEAENDAKYLKKGRRVNTHGELEVSVAHDSNGNVLYHRNQDGTPSKEPIVNLEINTKPRTNTEYLSNTSPIEGESNQSAPAPAAAPAAPKAPQPVNLEEDELPF